MPTESLSALSDEIGGLISDLGGLQPSPAVDRLEKEIAFLVFILKCRRMTGREMAIYHNGLARRYWISGERPIYSLHTRIEDLIEELKLW